MTPEDIQVHSDRRDTAIGGMLNYYAAKGGHEWIWPHVEYCARRGIVHFTPETCILARPVNIMEDPDWLSRFGDIVEGRELTDLTDPRAGWHVLFANGALSSFFPLCPYPLPWLMWQRGGGRGRIHRFETVRRHLEHLNPS